MKQELFEKMQQTWDMFVAEHAGTSKASQGRARKLSSELNKISNKRPK